MARSIHRDSRSVVPEFSILSLSLNHPWSLCAGKTPSATLAANRYVWDAMPTILPFRERSHSMATPMFASIRKYNSAPTLADELSKKQGEIKAVLAPISGFHAYYLIKTGDGAVSMTICENRAGAEESNRIEATW